MTAKGNIVAADGKPTPVNHTFVPSGETGGLFTWTDMSAAENPLGSPLGFNTINVSGKMSKDRGSSGRFTLDYRLKLPVLEQTSSAAASGFTPPPTLAFENAAFIKIVMANRCTLQQRDDLLSLMLHSFQDPQVWYWARNYTPPT